MIKGLFSKPKIVREKDEDPKKSEKETGKTINKLKTVNEEASSKDKRIDELLKIVTYSPVSL
jgi:hypothetical protein